jgi:hypothetical protein
MHGNLNNLDIISQTEHELLVKAGTGQTPNDLLQDLMNRGITITGFEELKPSLNEIFIRTVKSLGDA